MVTLEDTKVVKVTRRANNIPARSESNAASKRAIDSLLK